MDKELEITTPLDQSLQVDHIDILTEVDTFISGAIASKDVEYAFSFCKRMTDTMKRSGIALAKALWLIKHNWDIFQIGDDFEPTAQDYTGLHPHTIERYVKVWDMLINYVPAQLKEDALQKNIRSLIPIANAVAQGYEIENDTWDKLVKAPDYNEVSRIVREEVKEVNPRKSNLTIKVDQRGSLWAYANNGVYFVGSLEMKDENEFVRKAVERIITNSGILRG